MMLRSVSFRVAALLALLAAAILPACKFNSADNNAATSAPRLPYFGNYDVVAPGDTVYPTIGNFAVTNQDRQLVTPATFAGKVYVADFFFATCPTICPKMQSEMLRVYEKYKGDPRVAFLSHTIDPAHDSIPVLRDYAEKLGVPNASQWHFVTAPRDTIFRLAKTYVVAAQPDAEAPGGVVHSGAFVLIDPQQHIRGVYDGTVPEQVDQLLHDLPILLREVGETQTATARAGR